MNGLPKIRKNMIDLGTGWIVLNNEEDYLKIEFDDEYLFLEYDSENKCSFNYLEFKPDDGHLAILTRNVLLKLDNLPDLVAERMRKDGHDHEDFLDYVKQTVSEVLYFE